MRMPRQIQNAVNILWLWKLAILRLFVHGAIGIGTAYLGAMANQHWAELDGDSRFKLGVGIVIGFLNTVAAFVDKSSAKLAQGSVLPPDSGDTALVEKPT